jgi:hypothetical protein
VQWKQKIADIQIRLSGILSVNENRCDASGKVARIENEILQRGARGGLPFFLKSPVFPDNKVLRTKFQ